ncbi:MAG: DUF4383 domain-containing protein [Chthoniobacterales bacterium]
MVKTAAILFGVVFLVVGILGFVPAATPPMAGGEGGMLLGLFHVNTAHNIIHLASGVVFLLCGMAGAGPSRVFFKIFGVVYALVAVLGFMKGNGMLLGMVANNMADVWLHVVLAVSMLFLGFVAKDGVNA